MSGMRSMFRAPIVVAAEDRFGLGRPTAMASLADSGSGCPSARLLAARLRRAAGDAWLLKVSMALEDMLARDPVTRRPVPNLEWLESQVAEDPLAKPVA